MCGLMWTVGPTYKKVHLKAHMTVKVTQCYANFKSQGLVIKSHSLWISITLYHVLLLHKLDITSCVYHTLIAKQNVPEKWVTHLIHCRCRQL